MGCSDRDYERARRNLESGNLNSGLTFAVSCAEQKNFAEYMILHNFVSRKEERIKTTK